MDDDDHGLELEAFRQFVEVCNMSRRPAPRVLQGQDGMLSAVFTNKDSRQVISGEGSLREHSFQRKPRNNSNAVGAAIDLATALIDGKLVKNVRYDAPGGHLSEDEGFRLIDDIMNLSKAPNRPLHIGDNLTVHADREGNVHVNLAPPTAASRGIFIEKLLMAANAVEDEHAILLRALKEMPPTGLVEGVPLNWDIIPEIRKAKYKKVRGQDALSVEGTDKNITPYQLKESGMFTPYHVGDLEGTLAVRGKSDGKLMPIDPKTFKPQDASLKPQDYEWHIQGKELLTFMADNGFRFTGSAKYRSNELDL